MKASKEAAEKLQTALQAHDKRLQRILKCNGLISIEVPSDGNCFFNCIAIQLDDNNNSDANHIREAVIHEIVDHPDEYQPFLTTSSYSDIYKILLAGTWNADIIDAVPLATANAFDIKLRVFTSNPACPAMTICPRHITEKTKTVLLAHLSVPGQEHYQPIFLQEHGQTCTSKLVNKDPLLSDGAVCHNVENVENIPEFNGNVSDIVKEYTVPVTHGSNDTFSIHTINLDDSSSATISAYDQITGPSSLPVCDKLFPDINISFADGLTLDSMCSVSDEDIHQMSPQLENGPAGHSFADLGTCTNVKSGQHPETSDTIPVERTNIDLNKSDITSMQQPDEVNVDLPDQTIAGPCSPGLASSTPCAEQDGQSNEHTSSHDVTDQTLGDLSEAADNSYTHDVLGSLGSSPVSNDNVPPQQSPIKTKTRKRQKCKTKWLRNVRKEKYNAGLAHTNRKGNAIIAGKSLKKNPCKCKLNCSLQFPDEEREVLFSQFWALGSYERRCDFILNNVTQTHTDKGPKSCTCKETKRNISRQYSFITGNGSRIRVCQSFFVKTLGISDKTVSHTFAKRSNDHSVTDKRGRHDPKNKTPKHILQSVHDHIESFPKTESHYCRKDTRREYLGANLSVSKMYDLYVNQCKEKEVTYATLRVYRNIFNNKYNLGFHQPKKDECVLCTSYKAINNKTVNDILKYEEHLARKTEARMEKQRDKEEAQNEPHKYVFTYDLQAILSTPCNQASSLYYSRKLSAYNLTIYSLASKDSYAYIWDETQGKKGSCEIATCLLKHLGSLQSNVTNVTMFSDCCAGQNRNQYLVAALWKFVQENKNITQVNNKYLETGHTQMEVDSIHASIELAKKGVKVYVPHEWQTVIHMARRRNPCVVLPMDFMQFQDIKPFPKSNGLNMQKTIQGEKVHWLKIKHIQVNKGSDEILFRYNYHDDFKAICVIPRRNKRRSTPVTTATLVEVQHPQLYLHVLPISEAKKRDLISLCTKGVIPEIYHSYYEGLVSSVERRDSLPVPDIEESDYDTD